MPNTSTSQRTRNSVFLEIFTNLPCGDVGQSITTSCDAVPGPSNKPQTLLTSDSVTPTVTVTSFRRSDRSKICQKWILTGDVQQSCTFENKNENIS